VLVSFAVQEEVPAAEVPERAEATPAKAAATSEAESLPKRGRAKRAA
jgi:hypothetical protein